VPQFEAPSTLLTNKKLTIILFHNLYI